MAPRHAPRLPSYRSLRPRRCRRFGPLLCATRSCSSTEGRTTQCQYLNCRFEGLAPYFVGLTADAAGSR